MTEQSSVRFVIGIAILIFVVPSVISDTAVTDGLNLVSAHTPEFNGGGDEIFLAGTDREGNIFYTEWNHYAIMRFNTTTHDHAVYAGQRQQSNAVVLSGSKTEVRFHSADGSAGLASAVMATRDHNTFFVTLPDDNALVRIIDSGDSETSVLHVAGSGAPGQTVGEALAALLLKPHGCVFHTNGNVYFADGGTSSSQHLALRIAMLDPAQSLVANVVVGTTLNSLQLSGGESVPFYNRVFNLFEEYGSADLLIVTKTADAGAGQQQDELYILRHQLQGETTTIAAEIDEGHDVCQSQYGWGLFQLEETLPGEKYWFRFKKKSDGTYTKESTGLGGPQGAGASQFDQVKGCFFTEQNAFLWFGHRHNGQWYPRCIATNAGDLVIPATPTQERAMATQPYSQTTTHTPSQSSSHSLSLSRGSVDNSGPPGGEQTRPVTSSASSEIMDTEEPTQAPSIPSYIAPDTAQPAVSGKPNLTRHATYTESLIPAVVSSTRSPTVSHPWSEPPPSEAASPTTVPGVSPRVNDPQARSEGKSDSAGGGSLVIAVIAVVCVVLIVALVGTAVFIKKRRRMKKKTRGAVYRDADDNNVASESTREEPTSRVSVPVADHTQDGFQKGDEGDGSGEGEPLGSSNELEFNGLEDLANAPAATFVNVSGTKRSFELKRLIGTGSSGRVYEALHLPTQAFIAVKEIEFTGIESEMLSKLPLLKRELEAMRGLQHPNVVRYLGAERDGSAFFALMELVRGGSVRDYLDLHPAPPDPAWLRAVVQQLLGGLAYIHRQGCIHHDIKTENLLIVQKPSPTSDDSDDFDVASWEVKLVDFGSAAWIDASMRTVYGTPLSTAPEVMFGGRGSPAADIWSVGCVLMEMLTGKQPWAHLGVENNAQLLFKLNGFSSEEECEDEVELPEGAFDEHAVDFMRQCLRKAPQARPTAAELLKHPLLRGIRLEAV